MRYDIKQFNSAVKYYKKLLKNSKNILVVFDVSNEAAFYSIAPISRAVHELGADLSVYGIQGQSHVLNAMYHAWLLYQNPNRFVKPKETKALKDFIKATKIKGFRKIFHKPDTIIKATNQGFIGSVNMDFQPKWFKKYRWQMLLKTSKVIYSQVLNLKKKESVGIGFELIPKAKDLDKPLQDYLDSYAISWAMRKNVDKVFMTATSPRYSQLENMNPVAELKTTIIGCELSKDIKEPVFQKFKVLSKYIHADKIKIHDANFFITGKGYSGKHRFGEKIGYPDPSKKTRWQSPGMFIYQLDYYPQTRIDKRKPLSRIAFTETLPIDVFIRSCNIDWLKMQKKNERLKKIFDRAEKIVVSGKSNFEVGLVGKKRREARASGTSTRHLLNQRLLKKKIYAGNMANLPGGETFVTPEYLIGKVVGDVVISIDQSYRLNEKNPLIVNATKKGYTLKGPKKIINAINKRKKETMKRIKAYEKNKSMPKSIIKSTKDNFNRIGEFAINTNPKAELCDYLIVNEKIAGMIHVALGSGFDPDRATEYHMDIVINAKQQKLDIDAVTSRKKVALMKKGRLIV